MPWMRTNIDLSFPEIKQVLLDKKQQPKTDELYPLAYMRRESDSKIEKNEIKPQNKYVNKTEEFEQY